MKKLAFTFVALGIALTLGGYAGAQETEPAPTGDEEPQATPSGDDEVTQPEGPESTGEAAAEEEPMSEEEAFLAGEKTEEEELLEAPVTETSSRVEDPSTPYFGVGARFRWVMIPTWFLQLFGVDIETASDRHLLINNIGAGAEFNYRKKGFDITAAVWYLGLNWSEATAFKGSGEDGNSWEVIQNDMRAILITVDFIWSKSITDWFAITYGAGLGVGIPFGDIIRTESQQDKPLEPCQRASPSDGWCNTEEEYGKVYDLPTKIIPWINFLGGMRFKPHRHVAIYVDGGFGLGFQTGIRAQYIF